MINIHNPRHYISREFMALTTPRQLAIYDACCKCSTPYEILLEIGRGLDVDAFILFLFFKK